MFVQMLIATVVSNTSKTATVIKGWYFSAAHWCSGVVVGHVSFYDFYASCCSAVLLINTYPCKIQFYIHIYTVNRKKHIKMFLSCLSQNPVDSDKICCTLLWICLLQSNINVLIKDGVYLIFVRIRVFCKYMAKIILLCFLGSHINMHTCTLYTVHAVLCKMLNQIRRFIQESKSGYKKTTAVFRNSLWKHREIIGLIHST